MSLTILVATATAVVALLVYILRYAPLWWPLKVALSLGIAGYGAVFVIGIQAIMGYPVKSDPREMAYIASVVIDPSDRGPGAVYIWAKEGGGPPRAYEFPYSKRLAEQVERASAAGRMGRPTKLRKNADMTKFLGATAYDSVEPDEALPTKE